MAKISAKRAWGQGAKSLVGSRGKAHCGVWGKAPTSPLSTRRKQEPAVAPAAGRRNRFRASRLKPAQRCAESGAAFLRQPALPAETKTNSTCSYSSCKAPSNHHKSPAGVILRRALLLCGFRSGERRVALRFRRRRPPTATTAKRQSAIYGKRTSKGTLGRLPQTLPRGLAP